MSSTPNEELEEEKKTIRHYDKNEGVDKIKEVLRTYWRRSAIKDTKNNGIRNNYLSVH